MTPKQTWSEKLKHYRNGKSDLYARTILQKPQHTTLYTAMRFPGVIIVMGDIRKGKTGVAHEIAHQFNSRLQLPAVIHIPRAPESLRKIITKQLPSWMTIVSRCSQWAKDSVVIYDEAAQSAHARRSQSGDAIELDDLLSIAGQRRQLIIFIAHYSRKIDLNVCTAVHRILWKQPTYAHQLWERDELQDFSMKAFDFFQSIRGEKAKLKANLILDMDNFRFLQCNNSLPPWWSDDLSCLFQDVHRVGKGVPI